MTSDLSALLFVAPLFCMGEIEFFVLLPIKTATGTEIYFWPHTTFHVSIQQREGPIFLCVGFFWTGYGHWAPTKKISGRNHSAKNRRRKKEDVIEASPVVSLSSPCPIALPFGQEEEKKWVRYIDAKKKRIEIPIPPIFSHVVVLTLEAGVERVEAPKFRGASDNK